MAAPPQPFGPAAGDLAPDEGEIIQRPARPANRPPGRWPFYKAVGRTASVSLRFLGNYYTGRGDVACADRLSRWWSANILRDAHVTLRAVGRSHIAGGGPFVYMSNHASLLDIPALFVGVPGSLRMVAKKEIARLPLWGPAMRAAGVIEIDRGDHDKAVRQLELAKQRLREGVSIWIAPEGTRSRTGEFGAFKKGGFHVALDLQAPIVPLWITGSREALPPESIVLNYDRTITLYFGAPIATAGLDKADMPALMERVRAAMLELATRAGA